MEMSIDETEAIEILKDIRLNANYMQNKKSRTGMACELAVDTMRKYQKIEQILKSLDDGEINYPQMAYYLREVLEDGNDD